MESYNREKFLVEEYLGQTKSEVQNEDDIDGTKASPPPRSDIQSKSGNCKIE